MTEPELQMDDVWYSFEGTPLNYKGDEPSKQVHSKLFPQVQALEECQRDIHVQNILHAKLYTNRELMAFEWDSDYSTCFKPINTNIENIIQSVCDTLEARIGTVRPKATIISRGAEFEVFMKARRLDRFVWGEFVNHKVHNKTKQVFLDGCIYGNGFLKIDIDRTQNEIFVERVNPDEIVVDQRECVSGSMPMQMHHRKLVSRLWLLQVYGQNADNREKIIKAQGKDWSYTSYRTPAEQQVVVVESWKLPNGKNPGRHTMCIENCTLLDEEYTRERFPFVVFKWAEPQTGFYGRSLVSDLVGYQIRQNELNETQRLGMDLMSVPRILVENSSALATEKLDNSIAKVIRYRGEKPEALTWGAFPAEFYNERDRNSAKAFQFAGVSELSSQSKLPSQARLDSSEALREFSAIEDTRFNGKTQAFEEMHKEVAEHLIEMNALLYTKYKKRKTVVFHNRYLVDEIDWKEVSLEKDKYVLEIGASSILNMSPAARKDTLKEWLASGIIDVETYRSYSGQPDLEHLSDLMSSSKDYAEFQIDQMLKGEEGITPDPLMSLPQAFNVVHDTYQHIRCIKAPENVIDLFVAWIENAQFLMQPGPSPAEQMAAEQGLLPPQQAPIGQPGMDPAVMQ